MILALVFTLALASASVAQPSPETRHASGIALLQPIDLGAIREAGPPDEPLATAWSDAFTMASHNPDGLGYPWADRASGELVITVVNSDGEALAREWIKTGVLPNTRPSPFHPRTPNVPIRFRSVKHSVADLQRVMDDVILERVGGYAGTTKIWGTGPDHEKNRVIAETNAVDEEFLYALAATFGTEVVAVRVDPRAGAGMLLSSGSSPWSVGMSDAFALAGTSALAIVALALLRLRARRRSVRGGST